MLQENGQMKLTVNIDAETIDLEKIVRQSRSNILELGGLSLERETRKASPVDTGHLQGSWVNNTGKDRVQLTTSTHYARYVDEGTGLYGPYKTLIYPKDKNGSLMFKGGDGVTHIKYSKGIKGQHYIEKAINNFESKLPSVIAQAIRKTAGGS